MEELAEDYPEAAEYIQQAVEDHGEEWVLENYYTKINPIGQLMAVPDEEELPFFDEAKHDTMSEEERVDMYEAWAQYRENLRNASTEDTE